VTEALDRETQGEKQPDASPQEASSRTTVIAVSLAAMAIIGAATANSLPSFGRFALPDFQLALPSADRFSLPDFSRFSPPNFNRAAALPPASPAPVVVPAPVLVPDPVVRAGLRDIQTSQEQNADVLMSLIQGSAAQQADLKKITRQLSLLTAQVSSLQNQAPPLTTSSILPSTTSSVPRPNPRARVIRASRKVLAPVPSPVLPAALPGVLPALPKPAGPVSVGGAPLSPALAPGSGTS
jgi:hypothetical protein